MNMKMNMKKSTFLLSTVALVVSMLTSVPVFAQEEAIEEVVVLGSRAKPRSVSESAVPVDVISGDEFQKQGGSDLQDLLRNVVPSYNVNLQPISDAATVVRPMNLRGLAPDQTLILVNGKRRHRASVIYWLGNGVSEGAQGQDISPIPAISLRSVEVLRDGASAQYGSDAIAGVINFQLKEGGFDQGGALEVKYGAHPFSGGDGQIETYAWNQGFGSEDKWLNLSIEYGSQGETNRSVQRNDAIALIAHGVPVASPAQIWGQPIVNDDFKLFANYEVALGDTMKFYGHANYATKQVEGGFYFRNPHTRGGVFSSTGGDSLLVGDLESADPDDTICPDPEIEGGIIQDNYYENVGIDDSLTDADEIAADKAASEKSERCYSHIERFPGGFTPRFGADTADLAFLVGVKGEVGEKLTWDASVSSGTHESDFFIFNTVNSSIGPDTPTFFDPGAYAQTDVSINFDVTYQISDALFVAGGIESRTEEFTITAGQAESFSVGSPGDFAAGTHYLTLQGFTPASNGFSGFTDTSAGSWERSNFSLYVDGEYEPNESFFISGAIRHEDFDDFGTTTNYRFAGRYVVSDLVSLRASIGTGFRAPTPGQQNAFNITTQFNPVINDLENDATIPATHPLAVLSGGKQLEPEESANLSLGVVINHDLFDLTIDYFSIDVSNRLAPSSKFFKADLDADVIGPIEENNTEVLTLASYRFFVNDFETNTSGLDIVATRTVGLTKLSLSYNYTDTEVTDRNPELVGDGRVQLLQDGLPDTRWNLSAVRDFGENWSWVARLSRYGGWYDGEDGGYYDGKSLIDIEGTYTLDEDTTIAIGAQNLFNTVPDPSVTGAAGAGNAYSQFSPFGFNGSLWYLKYRYTY